MKELKKGSAIFVTGTPGTGKTTISRALARTLHARHIDPAKSLSQRGMPHKWDRTRRTAVVLPTRLRRHVVSMARQVDQGLVIDTHIVFVLPRSLCVKRVFVLRCHPSILEKRLIEKGWAKDKTHENVLAEILDICLWNALERYEERKVSEIDTTSLSPRAVVKQALQLETGQSGTRHRVDWISTLEKERRLERYVK